MLPATNRGAGGNFGFPDVCLTPMAPSPVPVPYPNFGFTMMATPFSPNVLITMVNAVNMASRAIMTTGDEGGVAHPTFKGSGGFTLGNLIVFINMLPGINLTSLTNGNNFNNPIGATLIPSVTNVFFTRRDGPPPFSEKEGSAEAVLPALDGDVATLRINEIRATLASRVFSALDGCEAAQTGVILDLRGCPGGVADAALELADDFLPRGVTLALRRDADGDVVPLRARRSQAYAMPLAVLIDGDTASAAEILAGVLQHHGRARVFGAASYGKGTARMLAALPQGARWVDAASFLLSDGTPLSGSGVHPDEPSAQPEEAAHRWLLNASS